MDEEIKQDEDIRQMIEKNLELTREIHEMTKKIKSYITFQKILSLFYLILIVVPILFSLIYLPPLIKNIFDQYQGVIKMNSGEQLNEIINK